MDTDKKTISPLKATNIAFGVLEFVVFAVSIFLHVQAQYAVANMESLSMFSAIFWSAGFILCVTAILTSVIIQKREGNPLRTFISIDVFVCVAILAWYVKSQF